MNRRAAVFAGVAGLCSTAVVCAQEQEARAVTLVVTAAGDRSVWFDHGRDVGLAVGTFVRVFAPGAGELEVEVRAVTQTSARADLPQGVPLPPVGTRGEARVVPPPAAAPDVPAHPPWTARVDPREPDQPLLEPTYGRAPEQRPATFAGRVFGSLQYSRDAAPGRDAEYLLARLGLRADATNVFGHGEQWLFAGELDDREHTVPGEDDAHRSARLDLLSVTFGGASYEPIGVQLGRFFSPHLPELGLVDGAELVARFQGGLRLGGGGGSYPLPFPERDAGDDLGVHAFADWTADEQRSLAATVGAQKTWHRGEPDRDLVLLRGEWRPAAALSLLGSARIDLYTSSDRVKGQGAELTEAYLQGAWTGGGLGTGLAASHFTWPELLREEYRDLPPDLVREGLVDRVSWWGSWRLAEPLSVRVRADLWRDEDRDGTAFGADGDFCGLWNDTSALAVSAFVNDGGYTAGPGARVTLRDRIGGASTRASWRWYHYEAPDLIGGPQTWVRQSVEAGVSWPIGARGDVELSVERWFGDREDATFLGLFMQWSF